MVRIFRSPHVCIGAALIATLVLSARASGQASVRAALQALGSQIDLQRLQDADRLIDDAIAAGRCPGAVMLVGKGDDWIYCRAYGNRSLEPAKVPETVDAIFDMASLTKAVATAPSIMILGERGKLALTDKVSKYIPDFAQNGKQDVTIEQILLHRGGLIPDNNIADYANGPAEAWKKILALPLKWPPGTHFAYSDMGYIVLGKIVEVVSGKPLDEFARKNVFEPLGMIHTRFRPPADWRELCAPTEQREGHWMIGEVHDPRSFALGGVAGHAGLFSTAQDLSRFCRMLLHHGMLDGKRVLSGSTYASMVEPRALPDGTGCRGYGFDIDTPYSGCRGDRFERGTTFGHTGFTGTMFWVDPVHECYLILLTNSVHPNGKGNILRLRHEVATIVAEALLGKSTPTTAPATRPAVARAEPVLCGIDVLEQNHFESLAGKRIALVTNHTGVDLQGNRTVDVLAAAQEVHLTKLFSPEHGLFGQADAKVADAVDPKTGLHVYSLYGKTEKPTPEMLKDIDAIVYDIQDVGARFYTYTTTLGYCMEAAAASKIPIFVLDRPNPITGLMVDGPLADEDDLSFIAFAPIPISHGMTHGELARFFNDERHIHCDLHVIAMKNWKRSMWWDQSQRMWINPSPNMRNTNQAMLYPGVCLLEATNVSVGRGTDQPFEMFGAPWIDGRKLAEALNAGDVPGLRFVPITFTPNSSKFSGKTCQGCYIEVIDREAVEPVRAGLVIAWTLRQLFGDAFQVDLVGHLMRNKETLEMLKRAGDPRLLWRTWEKQLKEFETARTKYLIYGE
jgi:uncharacterized protein YbbC (DUF1343 family)/CubicO group peptidase (beta-lactamase class C family)